MKKREKTKRKEEKEKKGEKSEFIEWRLEIGVILRIDRISQLNFVFFFVIEIDVNFIGNYHLKIDLVNFQFLFSNFN